MRFGRSKATKCLADGKLIEFEPDRGQEIGKTGAHRGVVIDDIDDRIGIVAGMGGAHTGTTIRPGRLKWKLAPPCGPASAQIRPPWDSTIERLMARPMPIPPFLVL